MGIFFSAGKGLADFTSSAGLLDQGSTTRSRETNNSTRRDTTTDYHQSLPGRLAEAVFIATELKRTNSYLQLICPRDQALGGRPSDHTPALIGTTCEAWANREWMEVLWHVVDRNMMAVEWSSGSGSLWILRRGLTLHTIEHWYVQSALTD